MEDQFGGRTDDDLFYDDFEPVDSEPVVIYEEAQPIPEPSLVAPVVSEPAQPRQSKPKKSSPRTKASSNSNSAPSPSPSPAPLQPQPQPQSQRQSQTKGGNLSSSRFARKGNNLNARQQPTPPPPASNSPAPTKDSEDKETNNHAKDARDNGDTPSPNVSTAPAKDKKPHMPSQNTAANAEARLQSGANPRQKLTEKELAAKMEEMKLLAAEKTRQFERAEKDEQQHAQAYAKGMEEARKRRAEEAERRRRGEEEKRKLDDERAKNRERKLKAIGMKDGGWDEGKEAILEDEARKGFKGANGGVRGTKRGGLGGSRYAREVVDDHPDVDRFLDDRQRGDRGRGGRGRGRGRGRGGDRGGLGGSSPHPNNRNAAAPTLTVDEFPALPSDKTKKPTEPVAPVAYPPKATPAAIPSLPSPPAGGKWDDEMEALDELKQQGKS
ncbi:hypothetical protein NOR_00151 [Metarhizium rileyi]|uniref:Uncharacterized protein n=1 Tax=Metarhizium rileyi (strain RCEF 4871) TaxID=1649241 RepID=A0A162K079_METRR|nr:hypothetical protein NOR_00151 [Metarhizium rileyi RCEF 4871]